jgi:hypothetical protein
MRKSFFFIFVPWNRFGSETFLVVMGTKERRGALSASMLILPDAGAH